MNSLDEHVATIRQHSQRLEPIPTGEAAVLRKLHNIEVVLFDVYGTLFVSSSGEFGTPSDVSTDDAFRQALSDIGLACSTENAHVARYLQNSIQSIHDRARQTGIDFPEVDILEVWRTTLKSLQQDGQLSHWREAADVAAASLRYELYTNPVWPMPGVAECLTELSSRGVRLGVISNGQWFTPLLFPALLGGALEAFGIAPEMHFWSYRAGRAKPSEYLYRQAAQAIGARGIQPEHVLHVGNDMLHDVLPATRTGFRTALFAGDRRSLRRRTDDPRVQALTPDLVVLDLRDLLSCVRPSQET